MKSHSAHDRNACQPVEHCYRHECPGVGVAIRRGIGSPPALDVGDGAFDISLSVPVALEYEEVSKRVEHQVLWSLEDVDDVLDYLFGVAKWTAIHFRWPVLADPSDNMLLELAVAAQCSYIATFNTKHFAGSEHFGVFSLHAF